MDAYGTTIAVSSGAAVFCLSLSLLPAPNPMARRLERLGRVAESGAGKRVERIEQIIGAERRSRLRGRLDAAGWYRSSPGTIALREAGGLAAGIALGVVLYLLFPNKLVGGAAGVMTALLGMRLPKIALDRAIAARRERISRDLPDFLDLFAATVRAGLALNAALLQAVDALRGPLEAELRTTLAEIKLGRPRGDALVSMADRIGASEVSTMVTAIVQAERVGANITAVLHELAVDTRNQRWMIAEERAAKLPIKMLFPMGMLMLPALYLVIFGPLAARLLAR